MTEYLTNSRNEVMGRMLEAARARGGNAVIGMRFDTSEMGDTWTEICAYGTAVVAIPVDDAARQTAAQLGYGQPGTRPAAARAEQQPSSPTQQAAAGPSRRCTSRPACNRPSRTRNRRPQPSQQPPAQQPYQYAGPPQQQQPQPTRRLPVPAGSSSSSSAQPVGFVGVRPTCDSCHDRCPRRPSGRV